MSEGADLSGLLEPCEFCGRPLMTGIEDEECHCCFECERTKPVVIAMRVALLEAYSRLDPVFDRALMDKICRLLDRSDSIRKGCQNG